MTNVLYAILIILFSLNGLFPRLSEGGLSQSAADPATELSVKPFPAGCSVVQKPRQERPAVLNRLPAVDGLVRDAAGQGSHWGGRRIASQSHHPAFTGPAPTLLAMGCLLTV